MATPYNPEWDDEFCARCLQLDDDCKCYELDEQDSDLCPVCQELPMPEFKSCSCWWCPDCGTTNPQQLLSCGGWGFVSRPDDIESVTRRLVAMANKMEGLSHYVGEFATLREAIDLLRTHALDSDHESMLD